LPSAPRSNFKAIAPPTKYNVVNTKNRMTSIEPVDRPSLLELCKAVLSVVTVRFGHVRTLSSCSLCNKEEKPLTAL